MASGFGLMSAFHPFLPLAPACANVGLNPEVCGCRSRMTELFSDGVGGGNASKRGTIVQRIILACAAFMLMATPLSAQQAPPDQSTPDQSVPPSQPPPESQPATDLPPPFVPPPPARFYDFHRPARHHGKAHHTRSAHHHVARHAKTRRHTAHGHRRAVHASKRTIRRCHGMNYRQIMRNGSCRALMRQELKSSEHRHRHVSHHHRSVRHHHAVHHRRR